MTVLQADSTAPLAICVDRGLKESHFRGEREGQNELPGEMAER